MVPYLTSHRSPGATNPASWNKRGGTTTVVSFFWPGGTRKKAVETSSKANDHFLSAAFAPDPPSPSGS